MDRPSQESKKPPDTKLAESFREEKGALSGSGLHLNGEVGHSGTRRVFEDGAHRSLRWSASSRVVP